MPIRYTTLWAVLVFAAACATPLAPSPLSICRFPEESGVAATTGDGRADVRVVYLFGDETGMALAREVARSLTRLTGVAFPYAAVTAPTLDGALCPGAECPRHAVAVGRLATLIDPHPPRGRTLRTHRWMKAGRALWLLQGAGTLGQQFAAYRFLRALGVRYYHPRETFAPWRPALRIAADVERTETPGFERRGWKLETAWPTPAAEAFAGADTAAAREILEWLVRNGRTHVAWSALAATPWSHVAAVAAEARMRGLSTGLSVLLAGARDGRVALFPAGVQRRGDPDHYASVISQAAAAGIEEIVVDVDLPDHLLGSEGSIIDQIALARAAAEARGLRFRLAVYPDDRVATEKDAVAQARTFDAAGALDVAGRGLPALFGAAATREAAVAIIDAETPRRSVAYMPATMRWRGSDVDVPLFLPAYWFANWLDLSRLQAYPELTGVTASDIGWEWGYWSNAAMIFEASWAPQATFANLVEDVFGPLGRNTCDRLTSSLAALAVAQHDAVEAGHLPWLVGPGRAVTAPAAVTDAAALATLDALVATWTVLERSLFPTLPRVDPGARPFIQEFVDGVVVSRLWMEHGADLMRAVMAAERQDYDEAAAYLESAREHTDLTALIVAAREPGYRYPAAQVAGVGRNATTYGYGYLQPTRSLDAWVDQEDRVSKIVHSVAGR